MKNENKGFTLIELSIVLMIMGFMSIGFLGMTKSVMDSSKLSDTKSKLKTIDEAIKNYVLQYGKLPCPAGIKLSIGDGGYGEEICKSENYIQSDNDKGVRNSGNILVGTIPTKALNLENSYSYDGWDDKFVYLVVKEYTNQNNAIYDNKVQNNNLINNMFSYSIVSNGRNQKNSYHYKAKKERRVTNDVDKQNSYSEIIGSNVITGDTNDNLDDIVIFKNKNILIQQINKFDQKCSGNIQELIETSGLSVSNCSFGDDGSNSGDYDLDYREKLFGNIKINNGLLDDSGQIDRRTINQCIIECVDYGRAIIYNHRTILYYKNQSSDN